MEDGRVISNAPLNSKGGTMSKAPFDFKNAGQQLRRQAKRRLRGAVGERGRAVLTRANYAFGGRPRINRSATAGMRYPDGRRAAIVISADLELAWAWRYARRVKDPLAYARERARQCRRNIATILDLC